MVIPLDSISVSIFQYGAVILRSDLFGKALVQKHHMISSVGAHSFHVAWFALFLAEELHMSVNKEDLVQAALCHDLGIVGRDEKYENNRECCRQHPEDSAVAARGLLHELSEIDEDAIRHHMWPVNPGRPQTAEGWLISTADKMAAFVEVCMPFICRHRDLIMMQKIAMPYFPM